MTPLDQAHRLLADEVPNGRAFFNVAARALAEGIGCRWAGVGELCDDDASVRLLAFRSDRGREEPFTFILHGSLCAEVYRAGPDGAYCCFIDQLAERLPSFPREVRLGARGYRGEAFRGLDGRPAGHVFAIMDRDVRDDPATRDFFRLVVRRAGSEYRRWHTDRDSTQRYDDQRLLVELATDEALVAGDLETAGGLITEAVAKRLEVERVGLWLLDDDRRKLRCRNLFERSKQIHSTGPTLFADHYPRYFEALTRGRAIDAHDARTDPRTREFTDSYLVPLGITSMLDATIRLAGEVVGVVCHEHIGEPRIWQADEMIFAAEAADLVAQALANHDRLRLERQLHEAQKMESLGVLAGGIAHDFNNLLVGILGGAELALAGLAPESDVRRHVEIVREAATRASDLCSQMLAYSGKGKFVLEAVDLSTVVEGTAYLVRASLRKDAVLNFQLAKDLPATEIDVTQVRQIVMNLLTNAADALPEEGGEVTVVTGSRVIGREDLSPAPAGASPPPGSYVFLEVSDTGSGMDEATRKRMFEPFFTTKFAGRGLGLAAVLGIVHSHGGGIDVDSDPRWGTRIRVYFPAIEDAARPAEERAVPPTRSPAGGTVLLVDDEDLVRQIASEMLQAAGFEILNACDGREAVEIVERHGGRIGAVVLDLTMPRMSGEAAFAEIRERRPGMPILLTSGYTEDEMLKRFAGKGIDAFMHKPFRAQSFIEAVQRLMARGAV